MPRNSSEVACRGGRREGRECSSSRTTHDYDEATTRNRDLIIDVLLQVRPAGRWTEPRDREFEVVTGMPGAAGSGPGAAGSGYVDYVLWGADGKPLALVEAKRTTREPAGRAAAGHACMPTAWKRQFGQRPVIFLQQRLRASLAVGRRGLAPQRPVQGFLHEAANCELLVQRRSSAQAAWPTADDRPQPSSPATTSTRAIRRIAETFEREHQRRKALVVMATGAGKTRTVIALVDLLMKLRTGSSACCSWPTAWRW